MDYLLDALVTFGGGDDAAFGKVSSINETLDALWGPFRSAAVGAPGDYDGLLGCYNLHREEPEAWNARYPYFFWNTGWGAPLKAHEFTMQLLRTYAGFADTADILEYDGGVFADPSTDFTQCEGLVPFLEGLLDGDAMTRSTSAGPVLTDHDTCFVRVNYRNAESYPAVGGICPADIVQDCSGGMIQAEGKECDGSGWSEWVPEWSERYECMGAEDVERCSRPPSGCRSSGWGGDWETTTAPVHLSFYGFVADRILFTARMARDLAIDKLLDGSDWSVWGEAYALFETATRIARYALRVFVEHGTLMVHELAHSYLGGGHCTGGKHCCFAAASLAWSCRVRAHLGLPRYAWRARSGGDYDNTDGLDRDDCAGCSSDGGVSRYLGFTCSIPTEGVAGEVGNVYARTCWPHAYASLACGASRFRGT